MVTLPRLAGTQIGGIPQTADLFVWTDAYGRVLDLADVYAAGDITAFPVKQGGIAADQALAAAQHIAASAGAPVEPKPFDPILHGLLLTGSTPRFFRAPLAGGHGEEARQRASRSGGHPARSAVTTCRTTLPGARAGRNEPAHTDASAGEPAVVLGPALTRSPRRRWRVSCASEAQAVCDGRVQFAADDPASANGPVATCRRGAVVADHTHLPHAQPGLQQRIVHVMVVARPLQRQGGASFRAFLSLSWPFPRSSSSRSSSPFCPLASASRPERCSGWSRRRSPPPRSRTSARRRRRDGRPPLLVKVGAMAALPRPMVAPAGLLARRPRFAPAMVRLLCRQGAVRSVRADRGRLRGSERTDDRGRRPGQARSSAGEIPHPSKASVRQPWRGVCSRGAAAGAPRRRTRRRAGRRCPRSEDAPTSRSPERSPAA